MAMKPSDSEFFTSIANQLDATANGILALNITSENYLLTSDDLERLGADAGETLVRLAERAPPDAPEPLQVVAGLRYLIPETDCGTRELLLYLSLVTSAIRGCCPDGFATRGQAPSCLVRWRVTREGATPKQLAKFERDLASWKAACLRGEVTDITTAPRPPGRVVQTPIVRGRFALESLNDAQLAVIDANGARDWAQACRVIAESLRQLGVAPRPLQKGARECGRPRVPAPVWSVLGVLDREQGPLTWKDIADKTGAYATGAYAKSTITSKAGPVLRENRWITSDGHFHTITALGRAAYREHHDATPTA